MQKKQLRKNRINNNYSAERLHERELVEEAEYPRQERSVQQVNQPTSLPAPRMSYGWKPEIQPNSRNEGIFRVYV